MTESIVLCGVGGQGILLASKVASQAALNAGFDVKTNEVHGMAQRGGSVIAQIRFGEKVYSPLVAEKSASVLGSLEAIEALRFAHLLREDGLCVASSQRIIPVTVSMGAGKYPADPGALLREKFPNLVYFDAAEAASKVGNVRAANIAVLGAISNGLSLPLEAWTDAIKSCVPERFLEVNLSAFNAGRNQK